MASAEVVELPKDRKGRTLHIDDEVLVCCGGNPVAQGEVTSLNAGSAGPGCLVRGSAHGHYRGQALSDKPRRLHAGRA